MQVLKLRARRGRIVLAVSGVAIVLVAGAILGACGAGGTAHGDGPASLSAPRAFRDDASAELATEGTNSLWLLVTGYNGQRLGAKVFEWDGSGWRQLPPPAKAVGGAGPVNIAVGAVGGSGARVPCVGFSDAESGRPVLKCWDEDTWRAQPLPRVARNAHLTQLQGDGEDLSVLFEGRRTSTKSSFRVFDLSAEGWATVGPIITGPPALAQLGGEGRSRRPAPLVAIETQGAESSRYVLTLERGGWEQLGAAIEDTGIGPLVR